MACNKELLAYAHQVVRARLLSRMGPEATDEALQTACVRLLEQPNPVPDDVLVVHLEALARVLGAQARFYARRDRKKLLRLPLPEPSGDVAQMELARDVRQAAATLPPRIAEAAWRRWALNESFATITRAMRISPKTVMRYLEIAQAVLREALKDYAPGAPRHAVRARAYRWANRRTRP